ncbi:MAG: alpha/beta hydrolase [Proteobacteria bacterium]|nr:MAG: alpha/beta hydrolase [Pseudomonadota bacterium]QKK10620.1 MAG: alpha/beta hydrolase [Pseudomonadota bacterium]
MNKQSETGFLTVDGVRLEYARFAAAQADLPTLVFLHEGLGCVALWKDFPERVAAATGCEVFVYSRIGYGKSDPVEVPRPLSYMHIEGLEVVSKVLDAAGIGEAVLVGHSDGGSIALVNAGAVHDRRVTGLVLLAPHVFNEAVCVESIRKVKIAYETTELRDKLARLHGDNVDCAFWGWNHAWLDPDFMQWNIEEYLPGVKVPILAIQGEDDEYGTLAQLDAIERQVNGPTERLVLPDCGHSPHRDQPEATLEAITGFVNTHYAQVRQNRMSVT